MAAETENDGATPTSGGPTPPPPVSRKRGRRLGSLGDLRAALAFVIRELEADRMDTRKGRALIYGLSTLAGILQGVDFEARLARVEAALAAAASATPTGSRRAA